MGALDEVIHDGDDVALAAVTAAELLVGVELADGARVERRGAFVERLLSDFPVLPYDLAAARAHGRLIAHCRRAGQTRGAHDLLIAATASSTHRTVVTADASGFGELPDVTVRVLPMPRGDLGSATT